MRVVCSVSAMRLDVLLFIAIKQNDDGDGSYYATVGGIHFTGWRSADHPTKEAAEEELQTYMKGAWGGAVSI